MKMYSWCTIWINIVFVIIRLLVPVQRILWIYNISYILIQCIEMNPRKTTENHMASITIRMHYSEFPISITLERRTFNSGPRLYVEIFQFSTGHSFCKKMFELIRFRFKQTEKWSFDRLKVCMDKFLLSGLNDF